MNFLILAGQLFSGVGISYIGARILRNSLHELSSRFSAFLKKKIVFMTGNYFFMVFFGVLITFLSGGEFAIVAYAFASFVSSKLITLQAAITMLIWGNLGTSLLFYIITFDINTLILYLVGFSGIFLFFYQNKRKSAPLTAACGFALVIYGMIVVKNTGPGWKSLISHWALFSTSYLPFWAFLAGIFGRLTFQLGWINVILSITMLEASLLSLNDVLYLHAGGRFGTGIATWLLLSHYPFPAKHVLTMGAIYNFLGFAITLACQWIENEAQIPLLKSLLTFLSPRPDLQVINMTILVSLMTCFLIAPFLRSLCNWLNAIYKDSTSENTFAQYIHAPIDDLNLAFERVFNQQLILFQKIPSYCTLLLEKKKTAEIKLNHLTLHQDFLEIEGYLHRFEVETSFRLKDFKRYNFIIYRGWLIFSLENEMYQWSLHISELFSKTNNNLIHSNIEALHASIETSIEVLKSAEAKDFDYFMELSFDKHEVVDRILQEWNESMKGIHLEVDIKNTFYKYEIIVWLLRRIVECTHHDKISF